MHMHPHSDETEDMLVAANSRTRRTRMTERHRRLVRETTLAPSNFILPLFIVEASASFRKPIESMPGVEQMGLEGILGKCEAALQAKLGGVILFGIPEHKDEFGSEAYNDRGVIQNALREIKQRFPELLVATDVCLCEYTEHVYCGKPGSCKEGV